MAEYILEILKSQLMVLFSWGPHNFKRLPNDKGLSFSVDGFKYQGCVKVIYNEGTDLFEIHFDDGRIEEDVYLDQLVDVIDNAVERTSNYDKRVSDQYNLG